MPLQLSRLYACLHQFCFSSHFPLECEFLLCLSRSSLLIPTPLCFDKTIYLTKSDPLNWCISSEIEPGRYGWHLCVIKEMQSGNIRKKRKKGTARRLKN